MTQRGRSDTIARLRSVKRATKELRACQGTVGRGPPAVWLLVPWRSENGQSESSSQRRQGQSGGGAQEASPPVGNRHLRVL